MIKSYYLPVIIILLVTFYSATAQAKNYNDHVITRSGYSGYSGSSSSNYSNNTSINNEPDRGNFHQGEHPGNGAITTHLPINNGIVLLLIAGIYIGIRAVKKAKSAKAIIS